MSVLVEKSSDRVVANQYEVLFHRHAGNPILTGRDWPYRMNSVFNAGATLLPDGSTLLLCRVEDRRGLSHLCAARSSNIGFTHGSVMLFRASRPTDATDAGSSASAVIARP